MARYPWELISIENQQLLRDDTLDLDLARSVTLTHDPEPLSIQLPINILYIESRPSNAVPLGNNEKRVVRTVLGNTEKFYVDELSYDGSGVPTFSQIIDYRQTKEYHVVHFDGHGQFARRCPQCGKLHWALSTICQHCEGGVPLSKPMGMLLLENESRGKEWVSADDLFYLLDQSSTHLVILSACKSAQVYGDTIFSGVASNLIRKGIPAVVAMQFPVQSLHAEKFFAAFYNELVLSGNVHEAMHKGRQALFRTESWYVPVLYSRPFNEEGKKRGQLFQPQQAILEGAK